MEAVQGFPALIGGTLEHDLGFIFQGFFLHFINPDTVLAGGSVWRPFPIVKGALTDPAEPLSHEIELSAVGRCV